MTDYKNNQQSEQRSGEGKPYSVSLGLGLPLDEGFSCDVRITDGSLGDIVLGSKPQATR